MLSVSNTSQADVAGLYRRLRWTWGGVPVWGRVSEAGRLLVLYRRAGDWLLARTEAGSPAKLRFSEALLLQTTARTQTRPPRRGWWALDQDWRWVAAPQVRVLPVQSSQPGLLDTLARPQLGAALLLPGLGLAACGLAVIRCLSHRSETTICWNK